MNGMKKLERLLAEVALDIGSYSPGARAFSIKVDGKTLSVSVDDANIAWGSARQSSRGALYPASHFEGSLQGISYTGCLSRILRMLSAGKTYAEARKELLTTWHPVVASDTAHGILSDVEKFLGIRQGDNVSVKK
jgi:hypothetical protein